MYTVYVNVSVKFVFTSQSQPQSTRQSSKEKY